MSPVFEVSRRDLADAQRLQSLRRDESHHYYWSDDWEPGFYRDLARAGFITVATEYTDPEWLLLPELQTAYAVLDWPEVKVDRATRRLLEGPVASGDWALVPGSSLHPVLEGLDAAHTPSWLGPPYQRLMARLWDDPRSDFRLETWELRHASGHLIAGELGYRLGATYTSLSGFFDRSTRLWNNAGKVQLVLLAQRLQAEGLAFWNLGHPTMAYKAALGARVLPRRDFLVRWDAAAAQPMPVSAG